jgi:hypothetical protein
MGTLKLSSAFDTFTKLLSVLSLSVLFLSGNGANYPLPPRKLKKRSVIATRSSEISKRTSVISTRNQKIDFYTQSAIFTHRV